MFRCFLYRNGVSNTSGQLYQIFFQNLYNNQFKILPFREQISYKKYTKKRTGITKKLFRMAPIHHHFELGGVKESTIVAVAHIISCVLAIFGGAAGLVISRG